MGRFADPEERRRHYLDLADDYEGQAARLEERLTAYAGRGEPDPALVAKAERLINTLLAYADGYRKHVELNHIS